MSKSIIDNPKFGKAIKNFNPNDSKFLESVKKRNKASEVWIDGLEKEAKKIDRKIDITRQIPVRINGRKRN